MKNLKEKIRIDLRSKYADLLKSWEGKHLSAQHRFHNGNEGEVILCFDSHCVISTYDGGRTWGNYEGVRNFPKCGLGIFQFENELIAVTGKETSRSFNGGRTWTQYFKIPSAVDVHHSGLVGPNAFSAIMTSHKRIVIVADYFVGQEGPDTQLLCSTISDDGGRTWQHSTLFGPTMPLPQNGPEGFGEPAVVEMPGDRLWMVFRTVYGELWQSISPDAGLSWRPACPTGLASPISNCYAKRIPWSRGIVLIWNLTRPGISGNFRDRTSLYHPRTNLVFSITHDNCRTWSCPITIEKMGGVYPTMHFTENEMYVLYQSSSADMPDSWGQYGLTLVVYDLKEVEKLKPWTKETIQPFIDEGLVAHWLSLKAWPKGLLEIID